MIKRITAEQLRIGMYVHDLECSWFAHPFAANRFEVETQEQIGAIRNLGVKSLLIDTDLGLDAAPTPTAAAADSTAGPGSGRVADRSRGTRLDRELARAARAVQTAGRLVADVMEAVRQGRQIELERVAPVVESLVASLLSNEDALLGFTRLRRVDRYTFEHSASVAVLLAVFGKHLGMDREDLVQLGIGGLLHDMGKVRISQKILEKPGPLSPGEWAIVRRHARDGLELLRRTPGISEVSLDIAGQHHERNDGSGYPLGIRGDGISLYGQMAAIVDVYDAVTTDRVYKPSVSPHVALKRLIGAAGHQLDADLVYNFVHCLGVYPIGTLVELSDGRFAVVQEMTEAGPLQPRVQVIFDGVQRRFLTPTLLDLSRQPSGRPVQIVGAQEPDRWRIRPENYLAHARV